MNKKKTVSWLVAGALTLVTALGAVGYQVVQAQSTTPTPTTPTTPGNAQSLMDRGMHAGGYTGQGLADALGISLETLQAAEKTATSEALQQAVADGLITQAQADQFSQNSANGFPMRGLPFLKNSSIDYDALLAKALGISTDELKAGYQKAFQASLDQAVAAGTLTQAQADLLKGHYLLANSATFQSSMKSAFEAGVQQAVSDGLITQAQADAILAQSNSQPGGWMDFGMGGFGGRGGHGGHGGPGGWGDFQGNGLAPAAPNSSTPSSSGTSTGSGA